MEYHEVNRSARLNRLVGSGLDLRLDAGDVVSELLCVALL